MWKTAIFPLKYQAKVVKTYLELLNNRSWTFLIFFFFLPSFVSLRARLIYMLKKILFLIELWFF